MLLPNNLTSLSTLLARLPQQKTAQFISVLLLIYIAFILAELTWLFVPSANQSQLTSVQPYSVNKSKQNKKMSVASIQKLNLFGLYSQEQKVDKTVIVKDAPETRLKLTLSGLVASDIYEIAAAIIESKGIQETYGVGDIIKGTRATLERVLMDRVLIKQSGRMETLMLDGFDFNQPAIAIEQKVVTQSVVNSTIKQSSLSVKTIDQRKNKNLSFTASGLRLDLNADPSKITDYLRIAPKQVKGKIIGYTVQPGKKPEFFKSSGLKSGDVAVQMNGHDLTVITEAVQALSELKTENNVSLLVQRGEELIEILFSID